MSPDKNSPETSNSPDVPFSDIKELLDHVTELGLEEIDIRKGDFRLHVINKRPQKIQNMITSGDVLQTSMSPQATSNAAPVGAPAAPESSEKKEEDDSHLKKITSPMVGTYYSSPAPEAPAFAKVGDVVSPDSVLCIVEAMKLMNEIKAEMSGKIARIYVENGQPVEYGQPIFGIEES